jgi:ADP-ribosylglycohydrolase
MCFIAACISAALSQNPTLDTIMQAGMSVVPKKSRLCEAIEWITQLHAEGNGWEYVNDKIYERWEHINWAGVMINIPICVLALLEGRMDYTRTVSVATMAGIDTDCNAATVGSITGAAKGFDAIPSTFVDPLNDTAAATVAGVGKGKISDFADRTVQLYHRLEEGN